MPNTRYTRVPYYSNMPIGSTPINQGTGLFYSLNIHNLILKLFNCGKWVIHLAIGLRFILPWATVLKLDLKIYLTVPLSYYMSIPMQNVTHVGMAWGKNISKHENVYIVHY